MRPGHHPAPRGGLQQLDGGDQPHGRWVRLPESSKVPVSARCVLCSLGRWAFYSSRGSRSCPLRSQGLADGTPAWNWDQPPGTVPAVAREGWLRTPCAASWLGLSRKGPHLLLRRGSAKNQGQEVGSEGAGGDGDRSEERACRAWAVRGQPRGGYRPQPGLLAGHQPSRSPPVEEPRHEPVCS